MTLQVNRFFIEKKRSIQLIMLWLLAAFKVFSQTPEPIFEYFSVKDGLLWNEIPYVLQDRTGYLWFCSANQLQRYDGYNFVSFRSETKNPNEFQNLLNTLYEDKSGKLWIGTWQGLEKLDPWTGLFTYYKLHNVKSGTEWNNRVLSICEDSFDNFWIGTAEGLIKVNKNDGSFISFYHNDSDPGTISHNSINVIFEDRNKSLWFGTGGGLDRLDRITGKFIHYWHDPVNRTPYDDWGTSKYWIKSICEDNQGILWLGSYGGLIRFDQRENLFTHYVHKTNNPQGLHGNKINAIAQDASGILWICLADSGIDAYNIKKNIFTHYFHDENNPSSIHSNRINSICCERSGTIWFTTQNGLIKLNWANVPFKNYLQPDLSNIIKGSRDYLFINVAKKSLKFFPANDKFSPSPIGNDRVLATEDNGNLWFTKADGGIFKREVTGQIKTFNDTTGNKFSKKVSAFYLSNKGIAWIGTTASGLFYIDPLTNTVRQKNNSASSINVIREDSYGVLWIGTWRGGLQFYNKKRDTLTVITTQLKDTSEVSFISVMDIHEDKKGNMWFGATTGLTKYDRLKKKFYSYDEKNGAVSSPVSSVLEDDHGNIWLSTVVRVVSKFDPVTKRFKNYDAAGGLPEEGSYGVIGCKTENGEMYLGWQNGFVRFHPDSIRDNLFKPPVVITSFRKFGYPSNLQKKIMLKYNDNFLSFEFAALSYISSERNQYAYKMEGLDKDWIYSGTRRYASYPNLEPGEYTFRVKGSNNDGVWNEAGISVKIFISPPWWKTWWAYSVYFALFISGLYGIRRYELNRAAWKNQVKLDEAVLKEKEETDRMKSRFFANISHEFRTPLTLILGPAEKIITRSSDDIIKDANVIKRNSRRLLQLINQLLDLSKLEAGRLKLEASLGNIVSFVKGIALSFESLSESKDITLKLIAEKEFIELYFDREKMMKILTNIISNAFKFTPTDGTITISVGKINKADNTSTVEIKVRDTGIGISQDEIPRLFDRFYQVDSSFTKEYEGTGIGLALTKELVELHHGQIRVESTKADLSTGQAGWTEVTVELPIGRDHLKDDEILSDKVKDSEMKVQVNEEDHLHSASAKEEVSDKAADEDKTIILIVEDNYDMREYIKEALGVEYQIEEAVNGEQGVRKAEKIIPDLIISDMMMPKMDGNQLLRIIKNNEKTSHIPVILLTARSGQEDKIEGLEMGADDYLTKPFDIKELKVRINNLISIRKKLQEKYSRAEYHMPEGNTGKADHLDKESGEVLPAPKEKILSSIDEKFMTRIIEVIEKHISEEEFSVENFGQEVGMSRMQIHRKLKALTGKSASHYIRSVKLEKAKKMIEAKKGNISEIAYSLGFGSPAYFTRCFREEFGYPPSELIN